VVESGCSVRARSLYCDLLRLLRGGRPGGKEGAEMSLVFVIFGVGCVIAFAATHDQVWYQAVILAYLTAIYWAIKEGQEKC